MDSAENRNPDLGTDSTPHPDPLLGRGGEGNRLGCQPGRLDAVGSSLSQAMKSKYYYWSVCNGAYGAMMEHCVRTAPNAGVFKEFHVLTDRPLEGCECYDACQLEKTHGLFKLHHLKVGMSRLSFDYFIWLDADTVFARNPFDLLGS